MDRHLIRVFRRIHEAPRVADVIAAIYNSRTVCDEDPICGKLARRVLDLLEPRGDAEPGACPRLEQFRRTLSALARAAAPPGEDAG